MPYFHFTPVEGIGLGAALTFASQSALQLFVVPKVEAGKRRAQKFEDRLAELETILNTQKLTARTGSADDEAMTRTFGFDWPAKQHPQHELFAEWPTELEDCLAVIRGGADRVDELGRAIERHNLAALFKVGMLCRDYWIHTTDLGYKTHMRRSTEHSPTEEEVKQLWVAEKEIRAALTAEVMRLTTTPTPAWHPPGRPGIKSKARRRYFVMKRWLTRRSLPPAG